MAPTSSFNTKIMARNVKKKTFDFLSILPFMIII